ncbi:MAG: RidA family protein [Rhodanobacter sp.]
MTEPFSRGDGYSKPVGRYTPVTTGMATIDAKIVTISGQVAVDHEGVVRCAGDAAGQAEIVFAQLLGLLGEVGGQLSDLQSVTIFLSSRKDFDAVNAVRNRFFATHAPASTLVIAQLLEPGCLIEVNGFAVVHTESGLPRGAIA